MKKPEQEDLNFEIWCSLAAEAFPVRDEMAHLSDTISSAEETCDDEQPMAECRQDTDASSTVSSNFGWDFNDDADTPLVLDEYELYEVHPDGIFEELQLRHVHPIITSPLNLVSVSTLEYPGHMVEFINREITYGKVRFPFMREGTHYQMVDNLDRGLASGEVLAVSSEASQARDRVEWQFSPTRFVIIGWTAKAERRWVYPSGRERALESGLYIHSVSRKTFWLSVQGGRRRRLGKVGLGGLHEEVRVPPALPAAINKYVQQMVRALFKTARIIYHGWPLAVQRVDYLLNWLPKTALNFDTPYHRVQGRTAPDLSHLWVFGCEIFFPGPDLRAHKLEPRAAIGRYVGHSEESASYLLLDEETGQIANAGVVSFAERF
ncbi:hypothetical protein CYMTET_41680 [Cymbomonas tetramitiformis]|uniref:Uncharacterized protein n=1 Tax=Cymbomonas tetramitiformis TaxID=36881 RepID=A0AAE0F3C5_9CHLO|nr:hypothetical protein CYMTET_41680 [Cymbomonas tetramitiformis]